MFSLHEKERIIKFEIISILGAQIEGGVDKSARILTEWRVSEAKAKKSSHVAARENEKLQDAMLDVR